VVTGFRSLNSQNGPRDRAVRAIARRRFSFPSKTHPDWKTWINTKEEQSKGIKTSGESVHPDIVVVDSKNKAVMVGEIETLDTVNENEAEQWARYSSLVTDFYLFVPQGFEDQARRLIQEGKIPISGIRIYRFDDSVLQISNIQ